MGYKCIGVGLTRDADINCHLNVLPVQHNSMLTQTQSEIVKKFVDSTTDLDQFTGSVIAAGDVDIPTTKHHLGNVFLLNAATGRESYAA